MTTPSLCRPRAAATALAFILLLGSACGPIGKEPPDCITKVKPLADPGLGGAGGAGSSLVFEGEFEAPVRWLSNVQRDEAQVEIRVERTGPVEEVSYVTDSGSCGDTHQRYSVTIEFSVDDGSFDEQVQTKVDDFGNGSASAFFRIDAAAFQGSFGLSKEPAASTAFSISFIDGTIHGMVSVDTARAEEEKGESGSPGSASGGTDILTF